MKAKEWDRSELVGEMMDEVVGGVVGEMEVTFLPVIFSNSIRIRIGITPLIPPPSMHKIFIPFLFPER